MVRAVADHRTGYIWTFPSEARDPGQIKPAALVACAVWFGLWSRWSSLFRTEPGPCGHGLRGAALAGRRHRWVTVGVAGVS